MIVDSTVADEIPSPSSSPSPPKKQKGIWTCMMSFHDAEKCWLHTSNGPCPRSQSHLCWRIQTLPRHSTKQEFGALYSRQRLRMGARASLSMRPSMVEALWKPYLQGNWAEGYSQYSTIGRRRRSKCDTIMLHIWQPYLCYSTLSTASELRLWAVAHTRQYTHLDPVCSLCLG